MSENRRGGDFFDSHCSLCCSNFHLRRSISSRDVWGILC